MYDAISVHHPGELKPAATADVFWLLASPHDSRKMAVPHRKILIRFLLKSLWFILLLNLVAFALTFISHLSLSSLFGYFGPEGWRRLLLLSILTLAPVLAIFSLAARRGWRNLSFVLLFFLMSVSTVAFFLLADFLAAAIR